MSPSGLSIVRPNSAPTNKFGDGVNGVPVQLAHEVVAFRLLLTSGEDAATFL